MAIDTETLEKLDVNPVLQRYIRELAVTLVDASRGYTMEFAGSPAQHRDYYDELEHDLLKSFAAFRDRNAL